MKSIRQTVLLTCVAVAASQYNYQQFLHRGEGSQHSQVSHSQASTQQQYDWQQYLPQNARSHEQYDWHQYVHNGHAAHGSVDWHHYAGNHSNGEHSNWHQYVHMRNGSVDWHQYAGNQSYGEHSNWHQYVHMRNGSVDWHKYEGNHTHFDWHQYVHMHNGSVNWQRYAQERNITEQELSRLPGNFTGDARDATTEDELKLWRQRAQITIHNFVPKAFRNESLADVDAEYQRNLDRINNPPAATEAPSAVTEAPAVAPTEAPAVAPTEAPVVVTTTVAATEAPVVTTAAPTAPPTTTAAPTPPPTTAKPTTHTTTWWLVAPMEMPAAVKARTTNLSESPFKQASPMLLMFALLAGVAMSAVAVGRSHRRAGSASEPLLTEHTVMP